MNDLERNIRDTLAGHESDAPAFDVADARRAAGRAHRRQVRNVGVGAIAGAAAAFVAFAGLGGLMRADRPSTVLHPPSSPPTCVASPVSDDAEVNGWPGTGRNQPGVYSLDWVKDRDGDPRNEGWMRNTFSPSPGHIEIVFQNAPERLNAPLRHTVVLGAECEATYRLVAGPLVTVEKWKLYVEGWTVIITLTAEPGASEAEVTEAHEIIESIRAERRDNELLGFRLLFTLTTDTWTSG